MSRPSAVKDTPIVRFPRVSGDEPDTTQEQTPASEFSPRERG